MDGSDTYPADANNFIVTYQITIDKASPTLSVSPSASSVTYTNALTLTATLSGTSAPTGTVTFYDGGTSIGTATVSGATASLTVNTLSVGTHAIAATYNGDSNNNTATGGTTATVIQVTPVIAVNASSTSSNNGASVALVATVTGASSPTGTVTFYEGSTQLGTATLSGPTAILMLGSFPPGSHTFTATYNGDINNVSVTSTSATLSAAKATTMLSVASSTMTPATAQSVTLTATLSGAISPTGTVTFKDGATILGTATVSGTTAIFATPALAKGSHAITAVYGGDGNNASATSSAITLTVGRPDPTADATVRGLVSSQVSSAVRFGQAQISNIFSRFEALHDEDDDGAGNGSGGGQQTARNGTGPTNIASASLTGDTRAANPLDSQASATSALGYASDLPVRTGAATQSDAGRAVSQLAAALPQAMDALNKTNLLPFHIWTAGTVDFGRLQNDNRFDNRFTSSGLTLGFDRRILDDLKAGMAVGLGFERTDGGTNGSRIDASSFDATLYASWRFLPHTYLDVAGGYGALRFDSRRWSGDGNVMLSGVRSGRDVFGSLGLSHVSKWDGFKLSSYGRLDVVRATLDGYSETGSSAWALSYDRMNTTSIASVLGGRLAYPILQSWGVLTPAVRAEWRHAFDGGYVQGLNYVDLVGLTSGYALSGTSTARDTMTGGLSVRADVGNALSLDLEYLLTSSLTGIESQRLRGAVKYGF
ncbi:Ig-like domain repeat protein [Bradyrhizobium sp. B117]|uniref:Ig-like domain repeat protein n=1 Tax=Bradyrhizobium sp. B117 TaxID=3140246 RepID=UPI0031839B0B